MVYSDTTTKAGLIQFEEGLCKLGDAGISSDTTLIRQFTAFNNQSLKKIASTLMRVDKHWIVDDDGYTDFPIATIDLVSGQRDYTLPASTGGGDPSTFYKLIRVRVMNTAGFYQVLTPLSPDAEESIASAFPAQYRLIGNSVRLSPKPLASAVTLTAGLEIQFQRAFKEFLYNDTSVQPPFMDSWHQAIAYDASATYLMPINTNLAISYMSIAKDMIHELKKDWARKDVSIENIFQAVYVDAR